MQLASLVQIWTGAVYVSFRAVAFRKAYINLFFSSPPIGTYMDRLGSLVMVKQTV